MFVSFEILSSSKHFGLRGSGFNFDHCQPGCTSDWGFGFANFWREIQSNINYIELGFELDQVIH